MSKLTHCYKDLKSLNDSIDFFYKEKSLNLSIIGSSLLGTSMLTSIAVGEIVQVDKLNLSTVLGVGSMAIISGFSGIRYRKNKATIGLLETEQERIERYIDDNYEDLYEEHLDEILGSNS